MRPTAPALTLLLVVASATTPAFAEQPMLGSDAPGFSLPALGGGEPVSLSDFAGGPVVLHFGTGW